MHSVTGSLAVHGTYFQAPAVKVRSSRQQQQPPDVSFPSKLHLTAIDATSQASTNLYESSQESRSQFASSIYMSTPDRNASATRSRHIGHGFGAKSVSSTFSEFELPSSAERVFSQHRAYGNVSQFGESSELPISSNDPLSLPISSDDSASNHLMQFRSRLENSPTYVSRVTYKLFISYTRLQPLGGMRAPAPRSGAVWRWLCCRLHNLCVKHLTVLLHGANVW
jgi:hypothetical protein